MPSDTVISVRNLSKLYRLGEVSTGVLAHDLNRWWSRLRGKEDPYARLGAVNDRTAKASSDYVWALRDTSFDVRRGEVLGVIGKNGAGKSTLLKLLSRVTSPTGGEIKVRGRIAALLEVGTGFHPELTGRENIFLNGAILGMRKPEIVRRLDEIVEFSGCERYVDTPVKRYSSGMYVRLAFAVAAHLDPDILIVDEVLAVGDAEFQQRCIGKMKDVAATSGRTVIFVSHNLSAVQSLCNSVIRMQEGTLVSATRDVQTEINLYLSNAQRGNSHFPKRLSAEITLNALKVSPDQVASRSRAEITVSLEASVATRMTDACILIYDAKGTRVAILDGRETGLAPMRLAAGRTDLVFDIANANLVPGTYNVGLYFHSGLTNVNLLDLLEMTVLETSAPGVPTYPAEHRGFALLDFKTRWQSPDTSPSTASV